MIELVGFGDVEMSLINYLRDRLDANWTVLTRLPDSGQQEQLVLLRATAQSYPRPQIQACIVDVQVYAGADKATKDAAALIQAYLVTAAGVDNVRAVRPSTGPAPIYDPDTKRPRYVFTLNVTLKGVVLP